MMKLIKNFLVLTVLSMAVHPCKRVNALPFSTNVSSYLPSNVTQTIDTILGGLQNYPALSSNYTACEQKVNAVAGSLVNPCVSSAITNSGKPSAVLKQFCSATCRNATLTAIDEVNKACFAGSPELSNFTSGLKNDIQTAFGMACIVSSDNTNCLETQLLSQNISLPSAWISVASGNLSSVLSPMTNMTNSTYNCDECAISQAIYYARNLTALTFVNINGFIGDYVNLTVIQNAALNLLDVCKKN